MKKIIAIALALVLTLALAVTCLAAEVPAAQNGDVKATYATGATADTVYSVNVAFGDMAFTYTAESEGTWNPETHAFDDKTPAAWTCTENQNKVTVTNHSNAAVNVTVTYAKATGYEGITGTVANDTFTLATAVGTAKAEAPTNTATLTLDGALASTHTAGAKIGTVTVSFS